jgi:hypothetical protein
MPAMPAIRIAEMQDLFRDRIGQLWCPATVTLTWQAPADLRAPSVSVDVIARARPEMTRDELHAACIQAAHDVLSAALLSLEEPQDVGLARPQFSHAAAQRRASAPSR